MTVTLKNNFVPDASTPWPQGWAKSIDSAGTIIREASTDSARERLTLAEAAGVGPTVEAPWYFMIYDNLYVAKGEKAIGTGRWVLNAASEIEAYEQTYTMGVSSTIVAGRYSGMMTFNVPVRPYRRLVEVHAFGYANVTGTIDLAAATDLDAANANNSLFKLARFGVGSGQTQFVADIGFIEADATVRVGVGVRGGSAGGTFTLSADSKLNEAFIKCYPVSMA